MLQVISHAKAVLFHNSRGDMFPLVRAVPTSHRKCYLRSVSGGTLNNLQVKGTLQCLKTEFWDLSPAMGLLHSAAPSLLANTRLIKSLSHELSKDLFYQRSKDGNRYGPVTLANSKSLPIRWLDTDQLGHIVGLAYMQSLQNNELDANYLDNELKRKDILCNYVQGTWTGISFARYRKMIHQLAMCMKDQRVLRQEYQDYRFIPPNYGLLTMMQCIWEKSSNKRDLWSYFQSLQNVVGDEIFTDSYSAAFSGTLDIDSNKQSHSWIQEQFSPQDIENNLEVSWNSLLSTQFSMASTEAKSTACALETLTASLAVQAAFKGAIRQGRYAYYSPRFGSTNSVTSRSIPTRPDCVEVVVREIIDNLLFDTSTGRLDLNLLPTTAHPDLLMYYERYQSGEITDIPYIASMKQLEGQSVVLHYSDKQNTSAGAVWFQLCCNLPMCEYLCHIDFSKDSANPDILVNSSKPQHINQGSLRSQDSWNLGDSLESYELTPTLRNVCAAIGQLLNTNSTEPWSKLNQVAEFWNKHLAEQGNVQRNLISVQESRSMFRAPLSDTEMIYRDIGHIQIGDNPFLMQVELEPAHQLASVKFIRSSNSKTDNPDGFWQQPALLKDRLFSIKLVESYSNEENLKRNQHLAGIQKEWRSLMQAILFPNHFPPLSQVLEGNTEKNMNEKRRLQNQYLWLQHSILSAKYGEEKWKPAIVLSSGDVTITQSTMSLSLAGQVRSQYLAVIQQGLSTLLEMKSILKKIEALDASTRVSAGRVSVSDMLMQERWKEIVNWYLTEAHSELTTSDLEQFLRCSFQESSSSSSLLNEYLSDFMMLYCDQYRINDGEYLKVLVVFLNQHSRQKYFSVLKETVFSRQPQFPLNVLSRSTAKFQHKDSPRNDKKTSLSLAHRWKLLKHFLSSFQSMKS